MAIVLSVILVVIAVVALDMLKNQGRQIQTIMATFKDFQDQLARISAATENIAADLVRLADQIAQGGLTSEQETEISEALKLAAEKLEAVAAVNPEPTPEPDPVDPV